MSSRIFFDFDDISDEEIRRLIKLADLAAYPRRGRTLILPPKRVLLGEVYGVNVCRGPAYKQVPYLECIEEVCRIIPGQPEDWT